MNHRVLPGLLISLSFVSISPACGPFFPDTVLDKPQASLAVPAVSYLAELHRIAGTAFPKNYGDSEASSFFKQLPLEEAQLRQEWKERGVADAEITKRLEHYSEVRKALLSGVEDSGRMSFSHAKGAAMDLPVRPLGAEYPSDIADYVEGARLQATGKTDEARAMWQAILERPRAERRLRGAWAAWMLAKTSKEMPECLASYQRVEKEVDEGAIDLIGLSPAAKSWRAPEEKDLVESLRLFYDAFRTGKESAALDVRHVSRKLLAEKQPDVLAKAAADPLIRRLLNLELQATFDSFSQLEDLAVSDADEEESEGEETPEEIPATLSDEWLRALEAHAPLPLEEGARLAWALYSKGRYEESRHWLELSPQDDPLAHWLQAKFDLRSGDMNAANTHLAAAIRGFSKRPDWNPANPYLEGEWSGSGEMLQRSFQGRLLADAGIVALARQEYPAALESLRRGGYEEDAAYVAEHVLSTDELLKHVRSVAPKWISCPAPENQQANEDDEEQVAVADSEPIDPATCLAPDVIGQYDWHITPDNRLRYELARRLAREGRLDEAVEFMPPALTRLMTHYRDLDRARVSGKLSGEALAAVTWREARIHRHWGAELFSTDSAPDGGVHYWQFAATDFVAMRSHLHGWSTTYDEEEVTNDGELEKERAIPIVNADEIRRAKEHPAPNPDRYHYRHIAADLAWKAAEILPDGYPQLAALYNTAGLWISGRDPKNADRFYQAMVKRCKDTEPGKQADTKRWFIGDMAALEDLAALPEELKK